MQLTDLLDHPEKVNQYRKNAADYVCERYNWNRITDQMLDLFTGERIADYSEYMPRHQMP